MKNLGRALFPAVLVIGFAGCVATQNDVLDLENQTDSLRTQISALNKTISSMQANQADLSSQMKDLRDTLSAFTDTVNSYQTNMNQLSSKIDDLSAAIASRVASIGSALTEAQAKGLAETKESLAKQAQAVLNSPTDLFNTADIRLSLKDYALAAQGFKDYTEKFPNGALVDAATYKLGRAYYGEKKWEDAGREFGLVIEKYPKSPIIPSSRLMYAFCLINMKKNISEAKQYLESIPADFPSSPEARVAKAELKKLSPHKSEGSEDDDAE